MFRKLLIGAVLIAGSSMAVSGPILFEEGFDGGLGIPAGWLYGNFSAPIGANANPWFQGNSAIFGADSGAADSYIASNFDAAAAGGNVEAWLATPVIFAPIGSVALEFAARSNGDLPGDQIEIFFNAVGSNLIEDFVSLGNLSALAIGDWGNHRFSTDVTSDTGFRFAFVYHVTDTSANGDYIGIDSVRVAVPEPGTLALMALGILLMPLFLRRRRVKI